MTAKLIKKFGFAIGCLAALSVIVAVLGASWLLTCGLVYLIMLCFDITFSWPIATGIWLMIISLNVIFNHSK